MNFMLIIPFVIYMGSLMLVGVWAYKKNKTVEDFYIAGRGLGPYTTAFSYIFTGLSGWVLTGLSGQASKQGPALWYMAAGSLVAHLFSWLFIGGRLRLYSERLGALTYPDYFAKRVRDNTKLIRIIGGISIVFFYTAYIAAQYLAASKVLGPLFGWTPFIAIIVTAIIVVFYCFAGGFLAVAVTDHIQGWVVLIGGSIMTIFVVVKSGGWGTIVNAVGHINPALATANMGMGQWALFGFIFHQLVFYLFSNHGRPHDSIRFFALKDASMTRLCAAIDLGAHIVSWWIGFIIGYVGLMHWPTNVDPESYFAMVSINLIHPAFGGIMLAAFMALMMSTVDSQILAASTALAKDLYGDVVKEGKLPEEFFLKLSRWATVLIAVIAAFIALKTPQNVFGMTLYASAGLACTFAPVLILSLYWKRLTKWGAISAMLSGFISVVVWNRLGLTPVIHEAIVGYIIAIAFGIGVSLLTKVEDSEAVEEEFMFISGKEQKAQNNT